MTDDHDRCEWVNVSSVTVSESRKMVVVCMSVCVCACLCVCVCYGFFVWFQMRKLVDACINPNPEQRPDISYVYDVAKRMYMPTGEPK